VRIRESRDFFFLPSSFVQLACLLNQPLSKQEFTIVKSAKKKSVFSNGLRFMVFTQSYLISRRYIHYRLQKVPGSSLASLYFHLFFVEVLMLSFPRSCNIQVSSQPYLFPSSWGTGHCWSLIEFLIANFRRSFHTLLSSQTPLSWKVCHLPPISLSLCTSTPSHYVHLSS